MPWQGGQKFSDKIYLKKFILGQKLTENFCPTQDKFHLGRTKFSENYCPRTKFFCPRTKTFIPKDKNFLKIFILGQIFSRTKIPVTELIEAMCSHIHFKCDCMMSQAEEYPRDHPLHQ